MTAEERLEKLEKELARAKRRNRWLLVAAGLVVGMCIAFYAIKRSAAGEPTKVIRANKFILEDEEGKSRGMLAVMEGVPGLALHHKNGKPLVMLAAAGDHARLSLWDEKDEMRVFLRVTEDGASLELCDEKGNLRAGLEVNKDGPALGLWDENGTGRAMISVDRQGTGLTLHSENGSGGAVLATTQIETPSGNVTAYPFLLLLGPDGKVIWSAPR